MANRQFRIKRLINQVPFIEGGFNTQDLPRGYDIEHVSYRLNGTLNVTTNFAGTVRAESPVQLVQRVELIADGKNTIDSVRGDMSNRIFTGMRRGQLGSLTPPTAQVIAAYPIMASFCLDRALVDGLRPKDSNLRTSGMQLLQTKFTFGTTAQTFNAGAGAGNISGAFVDVWTSELVEIPDANSKTTTRPLYLLKRSYQDIAVSANNASQDVSLPVGNVVRAVVFRGEGFTTAGEPDNGVLNNIILRVLTDVRYNLSYLQTREQNKFDYAFSTLPTGVAIADLACIGQEAGVRATECWDLTRASEAKATLSVNGPGAGAKVSIGVIELLS